MGGFYFLLSMYAFQAYIIDSGQLEKSSWFFLWPLAPYDAIFVPVFFYFQIIFKDRFVWKKRYLILFLPLLVGLIDVGYVYLQPDAVYDHILREAITTPEKRLGAKYWLLTLDEHVLMRHLWQSGVLLVLLPPLLKFIKEGNEDKLKSILNKWMLCFWVILMLMAVFAVLYAIEKMGIVTISYLLPDSGGVIVTLILYLAMLAIGIVPIYFPSILYGYPQMNKISESSAKDVAGDSSLKFGLEEATMNRKLELLSQQKLYLQQDFNLTTCAREMEVPAHHLSYFLKKHYDLTFTSYKNNLRMEYAKNLIAQGYLKNNTIEALALECGFASRTSFSKAFKKGVDISPSEYASRLEEAS